MEARGLHFARYADDCNIYVKSEMAADRVMKSITGWLERELRLKVSATKTKVVRPTKSTFLGFTFWKGTNGWQCKPATDRIKRLYVRTKEILCRRKSMKGVIKEYGEWMRHKVRVVILKQWKKRR